MVTTEASCAVKKRCADRVAAERAEKLELGLSLGGCGGGAAAAPSTGGFRRILTAEDFPSLGSRASPSSVSSNSSVSSTSGGLGSDEASGAEGGGIKTRADTGLNNTVRSGSSPSQSQVVGWPPIRTCRRNSLVNPSRIVNSDTKAATHQELSQSCSSNASKKGICGKDADRKAAHFGNSHFVKVYMDGDPIGRKLDLNSHLSYETLTFALREMFQKPNSLVNAATDGMFSKVFDGSSDFVVTYEDEDGDLMLVGDVPWEMFLHSAKRLRIMKALDAGALAPCLQSLKSSVGR
ncbi:Auxin-responsive protein IAA10 [Apostasia shenzhenica]|uniref:Auxin-responsive protein n=1 Tax=Apostasia shenzhenica TaxID=1088818 RepID=A0A2I0AB61_9ASPA|nr:Auxin-responsive protein IAA10 [Apostasia shenzhenica]